MDTTSHQRSYEKSGSRQTPTELSQRLQILKTCQSVLRQEFSPEEMKNWGKLMAEHSLAEMRYAFETYTRGADFLPKPKDIIALVSQFRQKRTEGFRPCANCEDGWVKVYEGNTVGWDSSPYGERGQLHPKPIDKKHGAMVRCQCFIDWKEGR